MVEYHNKLQEMDESQAEPVSHLDEEGKETDPIPQKVGC
jgi:hypothetical protein